jgi:hypothetical protein
VAFFAGARLAGARLAGARLAGAFLAGARLTVRLAGARLTAFLAVARFAGAFLAGARFTAVFLAGARLAGAFLAVEALLVVFFAAAFLGARATAESFPSSVVVGLSVHVVVPAGPLAAFAEAAFLAPLLALRLAAYGKPGGPHTLERDERASTRAAVLPRGSGIGMLLPGPSSEIASLPSTLAMSALWAIAVDVT